MYLIFDFDGTLVDSFNCVVKKAILLSKEFNLGKIEEHEIEQLRDLSSKNIIKFLKIPIFKIPKLILKMREHLHREIPKLAPVPQIQNVLKKLFEANFSLGILTSNSVENVLTWLKLHNLYDYFNFIHAESHFYSKEHLLKKTLQKYKIDKSKVFFICDETRDIDAAKMNNVKSVAVTWGYNSEKILLQHEPSFVAKRPEDILRICGCQK